MVSGEDVVEPIDLIWSGEMSACEMRCATGSAAIPADDFERTVGGVTRVPFRQRDCAAVTGPVAVATAVIATAASPITITLQTGRMSCRRRWMEKVAGGSCRVESIATWAGRCWRDWQERVVAVVALAAVGFVLLAAACTVLSVLQQLAVTVL